MIRRLTNTPIEQDLDDTRITIELAHRSRDGKLVYLDLDLESAGTRRLLVVLSLAFHALDEGVPLVIDEISASLHTHASAAILKLFCSPEDESQGGAAYSHHPRYQPDELASATVAISSGSQKKDADGATLLYPLTDIRTRRHDDFEKGYLQGRYGAVPFGRSHLVPWHAGIEARTAVTRT